MSLLKPCLQVAGQRPDCGQYLAVEKVKFTVDPIDQNWAEKAKLTKEQTMDIVILANIVSLAEQLSPAAQQVMQRGLKRSINSIPMPEGAKLSIRMTAEKELS